MSDSYGDSGYKDSNSDGASSAYTKDSPGVKEVTQLESGRYVGKNSDGSWSVFDTDGSFIEDGFSSKYNAEQYLSTPEAFDESMLEEYTSEMAIDWEEYFTYASEASIDAIWANVEATRQMAEDQIALLFGSILPQSLAATPDTVSQLNQVLSNEFYAALDVLDPNWEENLQISRDAVTNVTELVNTFMDKYAQQGISQAYSLADMVTQIGQQQLEIVPQVEALASQASAIASDWMSGNLTSQAVAAAAQVTAGEQAAAFGITGPASVKMETWASIQAVLGLQSAGITAAVNASNLWGQASTLYGTAAATAQTAQAMYSNAAALVAQSAQVAALPLSMAADYTNLLSAYRPAQVDVGSIFTNIMGTAADVGLVSANTMYTSGIDLTSNMMSSAVQVATANQGNAMELLSTYLTYNADVYAANMTLQVAAQTS